MDEYIGRNALLNDIEESVRFTVKSPTSAEMRGAHKIIDRIKCAPYADVVPVVRCKDCRHMLKEQYGRYCQIWGMYNGEGDEGFCNYGERKEG